MEMEGNIADGGLSSSIYETFLGTGPQASYLKRLNRESEDV
jgi:hypothetical protein